MPRLSRRNAIRGLAVLGAAAVASRPADADDAPLAIKGYDPVAYFTDGKPVLGHCHVNSCRTMGITCGCFASIMNHAERMSPAARC